MKKSNQQFLLNRSGWRKPASNYLKNKIKLSEVMKKAF